MTPRNLPAMTPEELKRLIREAVREEFHDAGLRVDAEHQDAAREDFRFLRKMRNAFDGAAAKIGYTVLLAIFAGVMWLLSAGANAWRNG